MASPPRQEQALDLEAQLKTMPFDDVGIIWDTEMNEWETGKRCWRTQKPDTKWSIVIQDDAIIGENFYQNIENALKAVPQKTCVSFYFGTTRPHKTKFKNAMAVAEETGASWIQGRTLHHGVCVAIPTKGILEVIEAVDTMALQYDNRLGFFFMARSLPVYYTVPSLVDHNDALPSLTSHHFAKRVAHFYQPALVENWNNKVVEMDV